MPLWFAKLSVRLYQTTLSPLLHLLSGPGFGCKFQPTCSEYAQEAFQMHGPWSGGALTLKRLCRCHPFSQRAGFDPVPHCGIDGSSRKVSPNGS